MNIEGKTVLDFTNDKKIINYFKKKFDVSTDEELKVFLKKSREVLNVNCLLELAHITGNKELLKSVMEYRDKENEIICNEMNRTGCIIG